MNLFEKRRLEYNDLIENTATRVPICLCLDTSYSMIIGRKIDAINNSVRTFIKDCLQNEYSRDSVDLCIVACGGSKPTVIQDFANIKDVQFTPLKAGGGTPLGESVNLCIDCIDEQIQKYDAVGLSRYRSWLIIMTDGKSSDSVTDSSRKLRGKLMDGTIKLKAIDMSNGEENNDLKNFTLDNKVEPISSMEITNFFMWLSQSVTNLSSGVPGEEKEALNFRSENDED